MALTTFDDLYPSRFLRACDLKGRRVQLTIERIDREELVQDDGTKKKKPIVWFEEKRKDIDEQAGIVLCKTNGLLLQSMFGPKLENWPGKRVFIGPDVWNRDPCIRVFGSPDIDSDRSVQITLPRRKPFTRKLCTSLQPEKPQAQHTAAQEQEPQQAPARQPGEEG